MRYGNALQHPCPVGCGSTNMVVFCYCCADSADMVCQDCGHVEVLPAIDGGMHPLALASWETGNHLTSEVGFLGKVDARESLSEALPGIFSNPKVQ